MVSFLSSLSFWESLEIVASLIVLLGVSGEFYLLLGPVHSQTACSQIESRKRSREIMFAAVVALGVGLELLALPFSLHDTHVEAARLTRQAEELRKANLELQAQVAARLSPSQRDKLLDLLARASKGRLSLVAEQHDIQAAIYRSQINDVLAQSGYSVHLRNVVMDMGVLFRLIGQG